MARTEFRLKLPRSFTGYFGPKNWGSVTQKEIRAQRNCDSGMGKNNTRGNKVW